MNDADDIRSGLNARLEEMLTHFWPGWVRHGRVAYCAPVNKADLGSFVVYLAPFGKHPRGKWFRNSAGIGGDEINLFAYGQTGQHHATRDVFDAARGWLGMARERPETADERKAREAAAARRKADQERREREEAARRARRAATAAEVWAECGPIAGTLAETYLRARGIPALPAGWAESLRFHPGLEYELAPDKPVLPALVARVDDVAGDLCAVWRIFLDPSGTKAKVDKAKVGLGPAGGGAVRLGGIADCVAVAEGVETALGYAALTGFRTPAWAALSTSGMKAIEIPIGVSRVVVIPDGDKPMRRQDGVYVPADPAGLSAAQSLASRLTADGIRNVVAPTPPIGQDYLDLWRQRPGEAA
jgi:hypothetical protein